MSVLLGILLAAVPASALTITASVNKNALALDDQVVLTVSVSGEAASLPDPELPSMPRFNVHGAGRSQSMTFANGHIANSAEYTFVLVPRSDYRIVDNWFVSGMCATGSKDIVIEEAFVPSYRVLDTSRAGNGDFTGWELHGRLSYRVPLRWILGWDLVACDDHVVLDATDASLVGARPDRLADAIVFGASPRSVRDVTVAGAPVVRAGRHVRYDAARAGFERALGRLT